VIATRAALVAAVMLIAVTGATAALGRSPTRPAHACAPPHSHLVVADRVGRIFSRRVIDTTSGNPYKAYYSCAYRVRRAVAFISSQFPDQDRHALIRLSGAFVAYEFKAACAGCEELQPEVVVTNLLSGATRHLVTFEQEPAVGAILALVVTPRGSAAFVDQRFSDFGPGVSYEVRTTSGAVLDSGPRVRPRSLRLRGSTLSWRDGLRTRRARLR